MNEPNFRGASTLPADQADIRRQQETGKSIDQSQQPWVRDGRMVSGVTKDAEELSVTHGLGRKPKGWLLMTPSGTADRVSLVQTGSDGSVVKLKNVGATGGLSFSLWVF